MATVYRVTDPHGQSYALKLLHQGPSQDKRWGTRFRREFRLLSRLHHKHLIQVHDYGEDEHNAYYVMDYIDGTNLWKFYREELRGKSVHERLTWLIPLVSQIVSALDYIHHHRVIHKDLKPANILLQHNGESAYLADFGLARDLKDSALYTHPGFMGTLGYSPPEIIERKQLDGRADIYSLGVILYTLLADRRPIQVEGRSFDQLLHAIREEEPIPIQKLLPDIHPGVARMIHTSIQKDPIRRYRDTRELWQDLLPLLEHYGQNRRGAATNDATLSPLTSEAEMWQPGADSVPHGGVLTQSEIVGRDEELNLCQNRLTTMRSQGASHLLVFYGIPGIGKTFFLEELERKLLHQTQQLKLIKLRPNPRPYGSLTDFLRALVPLMPTSVVHSANGQLLGQYLPGLQDLFPPSTMTAGPLTQPINQLTNLLLPMFLQLPADACPTWLVDDLHHADNASAEVLSRLLHRLLLQESFRFAMFGTMTYNGPSSAPAFQLPEHRCIEYHYLMQLSEKDEASLVARQLGREPNPRELKQIRDITRGLPKRTTELVHQGSLLAPIQPEDPSDPATSADALSSLSTAIHDLSSLQHELGLSLSQDAASAHGEEAGDATMLGSSPHGMSPPPPAESETGENTLVPQSSIHTQPELNAFQDRPSKPLMEEENVLALGELGETKRDTMGETRRDVMGETRREVPTATQQAPLRLPEGDQTMLQQNSPLIPILTPVPVVPDEDAAMYESTRIQKLPSVLTLLEEAESLESLESEAVPLSDEDFVSDDEPEIPDDPQEEPGEQTFLQTHLNPYATLPSRFEKATNEEESTADEIASRSMDQIAQPLVPKRLYEDDEDEDTIPPSSKQLELQRFAESSEELVLIPLLCRRLDMLDQGPRLRFCLTALLTEEFTYEELKSAIQAGAEETLDLINQLLSLRLLKVNDEEDEEHYSHLHPVMKRILLNEVPKERWTELSLRAGKAMATHREAYHRANNAALLAQRFTEGGDPINAVRWQLYAAQHALQSRIVDDIVARLGELKEQVEYWSSQGFHTELLEAIPPMLSPKEQEPMYQTTCDSLLFVGLLHTLEANESIPGISKTARQHLRALLNAQPSQFKQLMEFLRPLLQFAKLRVRKKK